MGQAKSQMTEQGWSCGDELVCSNCVQEQYISRFIERNAAGDTCDYCEQTNIKAVPLSRVVELIHESIIKEWCDPNNDAVSWESREGGWQYPLTAVNEVIFDHYEVECVNDKLYWDIANAFDDDLWVPINHCSLRYNDALRMGWQKFSHSLKHECRYFFHEKRDDIYNPSESIDTVEILHHLKDSINELCLIQVISQGTNIFRAHISGLDEKLSGAERLGSPPVAYAKLPNRMSPAGISMFYGAYDINVAITETYKPTPKEKKATVAKFCPTRDLNVIDLSNVLPVPSIFDSQNRDKRERIKFINDFIMDISNPIDREEKSHVDYVPTQVVCEYLKVAFEVQHQRLRGNEVLATDSFLEQVEPNAKSIDGLIYSSAQHDGGKAIVLFIDNTGCGEKGSGKLLELDETTEYKISSSINIEQHTNLNIFELSE